jgi:hypothetical protein
MKKIVSNILIVSTQLLVGGLFLLMLFSDNEVDNVVFVVKNNNLDKMADSVSVLFIEDSKVIESKDDNTEEELISTEDDNSIEEIADEENTIQEQFNNESESTEEVSVVEEESKELIVVDASGYTSNSARGFDVTTNNKMYSLTDDEFYKVASKVQCESHSNKDDILGVISVILNRADMCYSGNCDPVSVALQPYQFVCTASTPNDLVVEVVNDALNGVRNNTFTSFRSWSTSSYSDNYIAEGGNRYK